MPKIGRKTKARRVMRKKASSTPPVAHVLEDEYMVEKILDTIVCNGQIQYLIKWQGYSDQDNTWEPYKHVSNCVELIKDFESRLEADEELTKRDPIAAAEQDIPNPMSSAVLKAVADGVPPPGVLNPIGFARKLRPQKIIGATYCGGELCFLMKWRGSNIEELVPAREANVKCPQIVIAFYESKIKFKFGRSIAETLGRDEPAVAPPVVNEAENNVDVNIEEREDDNEDKDNVVAINEGAVMEGGNIEDGTNQDEKEGDETMENANVDETETGNIEDQHSLSFHTACDESIVNPNIVDEYNESRTMENGTFEDGNGTMEPENNVGEDIE